MPSKDIPQKLHAIWLGGTLTDDGKKNVLDWKMKNKEYIANLWVDSRTYSTSELKESYNALIDWAKKNQIIINDINPGIEENQRLSDVSYPSDVYKYMDSSKYYEDELFSKHPNYAAASDILRAEILYHQGGIYFDAEDVFPGESLGNLSTPHGILIHKTSNGLNNDLIASEVNGEMINSYRKVIKDNYEQLYELPKVHQLAHQSQFYESFRTKGRKDSTIRITGPGALAKGVNAVDGKLATLWGSINTAIMMNPNHFKLPPKQALSWFNSNAASNPDIIIAQFRTNIKDYFNMLIEFIEQENLHPESLETLKKFSNCISEFPPTKTMDQLLNHIRQNLSESEINILKNTEIPIQVTDDFGKTIWDRSIHYFQTTDEFLLYVKHAAIKEELLGQFMQRLKDMTNVDDYIVPDDFTSEYSPLSFKYFLHNIMPKGFNSLIEEKIYSKNNFNFDPAVHFKTFSDTDKTVIDEKVSQELHKSPKNSQLLSLSGLFKTKSPIAELKNTEEIKLIMDYIKKITKDMKSEESMDFERALKNREHGFVAGISHETKTPYIHDRFLSARFTEDGQLNFSARNDNKSPWQPISAMDAINREGLFKQIIDHQNEQSNEQEQSAGSKIK